MNNNIGRSPIGPCGYAGCGNQASHRCTVCNRALCYDAVWHRAGSSDPLCGYCNTILAKGVVYDLR